MGEPAHHQRPNAPLHEGKLPGVLGEIARVAGEAAALAIARARGGTRVYIPPEPPAEHWMSRLVGVGAARAIAAHLTMGAGGYRVDLPAGPEGHLGKQRAKADALIRAGGSERDIALATGYTERTVRRRKAKLNAPRDTRQRDFFSNDD